MHHDGYYLGDEGFTELRYIGWILPYKVYGERHYYIFDEDKRVMLIDSRDAEILLGTIEDGVRIFDAVEGDST